MHVSKMILYARRFLSHQHSVQPNHLLKLYGHTQIDPGTDCSEASCFSVAEYRLLLCGG